MLACWGARVVKAADQCSRPNAGHTADIERPAVLHAAEIATREIVSAPARRALFSNSDSTRNKRSFSARVEFKRSAASMANISRKKAQVFGPVFSDKSVSPASNSAGVAPRPARLYYVRGGAVIPLDRKKIECDQGAFDLLQTPHSRRSRGALVVRRPATDTPLLGIPPKDLAAPVPAGAVLSSGQSYSRVCLRLQAVGRRAAVPRAFHSLPHLHVLSQWSDETTEGFDGVQKAFAGGANV